MLQPSPIPDETQLRLLAGSSWERAEDLVRRHCVFVSTSSPEGIAGSVLGNELYKTRVWLDRGSVLIACTCPVGAFCKHGFALALTWTRQQRRGRKGAAAAAPAAAEPDDGGFASQDVLRAWAREHQVEHALGQPAPLLAPHLSPQLRYEVMYVGPQLTIGQLACPDSDTVKYTRYTRALAKGARAYLEAEAQGVAEGVAEEALRPTRAPVAEVAPLWEPLVELRRAFRAQITPRCRRQLALGHWTFRPERIQVVWRDPDHGHQYEKVATLAFVNGAPVVSCPCATKVGETLMCRHGLALIDRTLDVLENPEQRSVAIQATTELTRPGWSRVMDALDRVVSEHKKGSAAAIEVWWQIESTFSLDVVAIVRKVGKRGTLTAGARTGANRLLLDQPDLDPRDREIAELVEQFHDGGVRRSLYPHRALAALIGHPRVRDAKGDPIEVKQCALGLAARAAGEGLIRLEPEVDGRRLEHARLADLLATSGPGGEPMVLLEPGRCLMVTADARIRDLCTKLIAHGDLFPPGVHEPLLEAITRLEGQVPVSIPPELKGIEYAATPVVVTRVRLIGPGRGLGDGSSTQLELEVLVRPAVGTPLFTPGEGREDVLVVRDGVRGYVRRRLGDEWALVRERLAALPLATATEGPPGYYVLGTLDTALDVVAALQKPPAGIEAQWVDERPRLVRRARAKGLRVEITRDRDWFGIEGSLEIEEERVELAVLLDAMRQDQRYVRVGAASWVELSDELRARLIPLADHTYAARDGLALSLGAVPAIAELTDAGAQVTTAPTWTLVAERLVQSRSLAPKPPSSLRKVLRPYQVEGHAWLTRIAAWGAGACLADDMGLGKTLQAIAVLVDRAKHGPAIVIAPTSVTPNWVSELARFAPKLRAVLLTEQDDRVASLASLRAGDVLIVSYGLLIREIDRLAALPFATLIADEAQALKNADTRRAKAARRIDAELRIALTGTPLENHLGELWSIFSIVFPGLLGSWEQFRARFASPIERGEGSSDDDARLAAEHARASLARVLRPFLLRRTKGEVARELPARTEIEIAIEMSAAERELYEDARLAALAHLSTKGIGVRAEQRRFQVLAELTKLRLLASHPRLFDSSSEVLSSKLERLLEIVEELRAGGHRALVFSQFTKHLALVREQLDRAGVVSLYLDGETPTKERARRIAAFQAGEAELFLISLKAGGTGINLTAADYVIHLDPWWNPAVEDQASDRAHRIGQTKPVTVYRLITTGTVEQKILAMHGSKRRLVSAVLDGTGAAAKLSTDDLLELLAPQRS